MKQIDRIYKTYMCGKCGHTFSKAGFEMCPCEKSFVDLNIGLVRIGGSVVNVVSTSSIAPEPQPDIKPDIEPDIVRQTHGIEPTDEAIHNAVKILKEAPVETEGRYVLEPQPSDVEDKIGRVLEVMESGNEFWHDESTAYWRVYIEALIAQEKREAAVEALKRLPRPEGKMTTSAYGVKVDWEIDQLIAEYEKGEANE